MRVRQNAAGEGEFFLLNSEIHQGLIMSYSSLKRSTIFAAALLSIFAMTAPYAHEGHDHHAMDMATKQPIKFRTASYTIPSVQLVREDGKAVDLVSEIDDGRAVVLNFVYTSCSDVCLLTSEMLSQFQIS
jgi:protein SCO1/2